MTAGHSALFAAIFLLEWKGLMRIMAAELGQRPPNVTVDELLRVGMTALEADRARAHALFRQAALADPYDERVWLHLLRAVETDADRRVCLQNIIAINPLHADARRQLRALDVARRVAEAEARRLARRPKRRWPVFRSALIAGLGIGLIAAVLGVFFSVLVYGIGVLPPPFWLR